jgi:hypothetical protein
MRSCSLRCECDRNDMLVRRKLRRRHTVQCFTISVEVIDHQHSIFLVRDAEDVDSVAISNDDAIGTNTIQTLFISNSHSSSKVLGNRRGNVHGPPIAFAIAAGSTFRQAQRPVCRRSHRRQRPATPAIESKWLRSKRELIVVSCA